VPRIQLFSHLIVKLLPNINLIMMRAFLLGSALLVACGAFTQVSGQIFIGSTEVDTSTIVSGLDTPWEILWGPDDHIWFTERSGKISRVHPGSGELTELITIGEVYEQGESGLLGMVLHPDFNNHPHVFVVYTYFESSDIKERLVRYTYTEGTLVSPLTLLEGIDGASTHDGSRLVIDADQKLYMTTGDAAQTSLSQDLNSLSGKVLRLNLDGSVPDDNPISGSYLWSWGHRNAQGLVISPSGIMYSSEHGPSSDDEVNIIEKGRNYGWPTVRGFCDTGTETQFCADSSVYEPIAAWTPTLAVAGMDFYQSGDIPHWSNSLLLTTLKEAELVVLELSQDGRSVVQEEIYFDNWWGRLRDLCISPDGRIFLAVSNRDGRGSVRPADDRIVEIAAVDLTSDIEARESEDLRISVYPNPFGAEGFHVEYVISEEAELKVFDQLGREVYRRKLLPSENQLRMILPGEPGIYNLVISNRKVSRHMKVVKL